MSIIVGAVGRAASGELGPHLVPGRQGAARDAYRVLGYRQCGERAVRVDILERLADLIRPALAWRETSPGEKPTGAFDGRGFVVTQAMTSLTGSAGEDFASILRALGYRMDKRPPLPPKPAPEVVVETVSAETPPVEASAETTAGDNGRDAGGRSRRRPVDVGDPAPSASLLPTVTPVERSARRGGRDGTRRSGCRACRRSPAAEAPVEQVEAASAPEAAAEPAASEAAPSEAAAAEAPAAEAPAAEAKPEAPAEPALVEVWRPGGRSEERRPHQDRNRQRHRGRPAEGAAAAAASQRRSRRGRAARAAPSPWPPQQRFQKAPRGCAGGRHGCASASGGC